MSDSSQGSTKEADKQSKSPPSQSLGGKSTPVFTGHETFENLTDSRTESVCTFQCVFYLDSNCFPRLNSATPCFHVCLSPIQS